MADINLNRLWKVSGIAAVLSVTGSYLILSLIEQGSGLVDSPVVMFPYVLWITIGAPITSFTLTQSKLFGDKYDDKELGLALMIGALPFTSVVVSLVTEQDSFSGVIGTIALIAIIPGLILTEAGLPFKVAFALGAGLFTILSTVFALVFEKKTEFL